MKTRVTLVLTNNWTCFRKKGIGSYILFHNKKGNHNNSSERKMMYTEQGNEKVRRLYKTLPTETSTSRSSLCSRSLVLFLDARLRGSRQGVPGTLVWTSVRVITSSRRSTTPQRSRQTKVPLGSCPVSLVDRPYSKPKVSSRRFGLI